MRSSSSRSAAAAVLLLCIVSHALPAQQSAADAREATGRETLVVSPAEMGILAVHNDTGVEIAYLFCSPADAPSWGADILGSGFSLAAGTAREFYLTAPETVTRWDILAVDANRDAYIIWNAEFAGSAETTITVGRDDFESGYDLPPLASVSIANRTQTDIWYAFLRPEGSPALGVDVLGPETILEPGETFSVLVPVGDEPVRYDVLALDVLPSGYGFPIELSRRRMVNRFSITD